ncbi:MAG: hypothetical protein MHM6MM_002920 [Cercozoa sp. M6MM]
MPAAGNSKQASLDEQRLLAEQLAESMGPPPLPPPIEDPQAPPPVPPPMMPPQVPPPMMPPQVPPSMMPPQVPLDLPPEVAEPDVFDSDAIDSDFDAILDDAAAEFEKELDEEKQSTKRQHILNEVFSTELSYVQSLEVACEVVVRPLLHYLRGQYKGHAKTQTVLDMLDDVQQVLSVNSVFLTHLTNYKTTGTPSLADCFKNLVPELEVYERFAQNHCSARKRLTDLSQESGYQEKLASLLTDPRLRGQTLESFLVMPIQRPPRYRMLLADLIKRTPDSLGQEKHELQEALELVEQAASEVNESIRKREQLEAVIGLCKEFATSPGWDETGRRRLIRRGQLTHMPDRAQLGKKKTAEEKTYEFFLLNDKVAYASTTALGKLKLVNVLPLDENFDVRDLPSKFFKGHCFEMLTGSGKKGRRNAQTTIIVSCPTARDKREWMKDISACAEEQRRLREDEAFAEKQSRVGFFRRASKKKSKPKGRVSSVHLRTQALGIDKNRSPLSAESESTSDGGETTLAPPQSEARHSISVVPTSPAGAAPTLSRAQSLSVQSRLSPLSEPRLSPRASPPSARGRGSSLMTSVIDPNSSPSSELTAPRRRSLFGSIRRKKKAAHPSAAQVLGSAS